jgi:tight adherence protein C
MILATVIFLIFAYLYLSAGKDISDIMLVCCCEKQEDEIGKIQIEMQMLAERVKKESERDRKKTMKSAKKLKKRLKSANKLLETYQKKKIAGIDLIPTAGYRLLQLLKWDAKNTYIKNLYEKCQRYKEKKEAMNYTYYIFGNMFGYVLIGLFGCFFAIGFCLAAGIGTRGFIVGIAVLLLCFIVGYLPYDEVQGIVKRRAEEIEHDFPQLVSQMTLLIIAGIEVSRAWKLSSAGGKGALYEEMCRVNLDLDNNVAPVEAYSRFIARCNNKYTTKLATAIMQNLTKGNSEIAKVFRQLNDESWSEHRHNARRMSEVVQSKLFIPTMLMFAGILILVIVPVMSGFSF